MVVVGGGVAGVSCALELAERGVDVTLLESRASLGGKVRGWHDAAGDSLEHGLHGWWLDYTNFRDLLARAGLAGNLAEPIGPLTLIHRDGRVDRMTFADLPSPLHALGLVRGMRTLSLRELLSALGAGLAIAAFDPAVDYAELDLIDFGTWLRQHGVSRRAAEVVFASTLRANLFLLPEQTSAAAAIAAFHNGSRRRDSWSFSWLRGNPQEYLWGPLGDRLAAAGCEVRTGTRVTEVLRDDERVTGVAAADPGGAPVELPAEHVVVAVDIESFKTLVRPWVVARPLEHGRFFSAALNLHATDVLVTRTWFEGAVAPRHRDGFLIGFRIVDSFFDVSAFQPELDRPATLVIETQSYLGSSWMRAPEETIRELVLRDLTEAVPELADAEPAKTVVLRHPGLFTAFGLGFESSRPSTRTPIPNLHLAGDWVRAPQAVMFMENAVVTGRHAASAVLTAEGREPVPVLAPRPADPLVPALRRARRVRRRVAHALRRAVGYRGIGELDRA